MMGLATPAMTAWMRNAQLRTTADSIQNGLQLARSEAVRRNEFVTYTQSGTGSTVTTEDTTIQTGAGEASGTTSVRASQNTVVFSGLGWVTPTADATFDVTNPGGRRLRRLGWHHALSAADRVGRRANPDCDRRQRAAQPQPAP